MDTSSPEIGIRQLRQDLAAAVRRAGSGEHLVVTVGGRPVAQLGPLDGVAGQVRLADLVARGLVLGPRRSGPHRPAAAVPVWAGARIDRLLAELRG
jgi:antitoxin (DNA-binding transcriptional repressor) of toxin-antitoxin stability system